MKTFTVAVPDEEIKSFEAFLAQSNSTVISEKRDDFNISVSVTEIEIESVLPSRPLDNNIMAQLERELEEEIWKLHHFAE